MDLPLGRLGTSALCILVGDTRVILSKWRKKNSLWFVLLVVMIARARAEDRFRGLVQRCTADKGPERQILNAQR